MGLFRKNSDYSFDGTFKYSSIDEINQAERRLANKKQALEDMQNEYNLIEEQTFKVYKSNVEYFIISQDGFIDDCKKWLHMMKENKDNDGNKLDGRKSYKEKGIYEYYIGIIKDLLGIEEMNDVEFIDFNFGEANIIRFTYLGHKWNLEIPNIQKISLKSYKSYGESVFKLRVGHMNGCMDEFVGNTFEEDDLKDIMKKGIEKYVQSSKD